MAFQKQAQGSMLSPHTHLCLCPLQKSTKCKCSPSLVSWSSKLTKSKEWTVGINVKPGGSEPWGYNLGLATGI